MHTISAFIKHLGAVLFGLLAILEPTVPFAFILFFAIVLDCLSAYDLNRRLKKQHPGKVTGKFQSRYAFKMLNTFIKAYLVIILLHYIDAVLLPHLTLHLANFGAALFCFIQLWSVLENTSSANGMAWARILQKIMVDKAQRHFNIDLNDLKPKITEDRNETC